MGKGADVGVGRKTARKRAVGTREHIIAYLTEVNELFDANGMASTQLAAAVGYPGSSVAFAQLLSGMERSGLIEREVRGKRTYRISLGPAHVRRAGRARLRACHSGVGAAGVAAPELRGRRRPLGLAGHRRSAVGREYRGRHRSGRLRLRRAGPPPAGPGGQAAGRGRTEVSPGCFGPDRSAPGSFGTAGDGHRPGVRAGHGVDQARQAGRGERPAAGAAQGRAAVAGAGRRTGPQAAGQHRPGQQRGRAAAAAARLGRRGTSPDDSGQAGLAEAPSCSARPALG